LKKGRRERPEKRPARGRMRCMGGAGGRRRRRQVGPAWQRVKERGREKLSRAVKRAERGAGPRVLLAVGRKRAHERERRADRLLGYMG
jgi:hypothetical protein